MEDALNAVSIEGIVKTFGNKVVLNGVSFTVRKGNIHGLLGHNGAGKTTLFRIILGLLNPDKGSVKIFGVDPKLDPSIKSKIGYVSEHLAFYSQLTVRENLIRFGDLKGVSDCKKVVEDLIRRFELSDFADVKFAKLSMGTKQRVAIARAMMNNPKLLILDEFLANIDPVWRHRIKGILKDLKKDDVAILVSTHILADVEELCDYVTIIRMGEILYDGSLDDLYQKTGLKNLVAKINTNNNKAYEILACINASKAEDGTLIVPVRSEEEVSTIIQTLVDNKMSVYEARVLKPSLEEVYSRLHRGC
ncbi:MAG: ABC transporter ATP-binding protein [Thermoproteota archaeon]